jgi:hypothetical protein
LQSDGATIIDLSAALSDPVYLINPNLPLSGGMDFLEQLAMMKQIEGPYKETQYAVEKLEGLCRP